MRWDDYGDTAAGLADLEPKNLAERREETLSYQTVGAPQVKLRMNNKSLVLKPQVSRFAYLSIRPTKNNRKFQQLFVRHGF